MYRRQGVGCKYTHDFEAAVEDLKADKRFAHIAESASSVVDFHSAWGRHGWAYSAIPRAHVQSMTERLFLDDRFEPALLREHWQEGWTALLIHGGNGDTIQAFHRTIEFVNFSELCNILTRLYGESCSVCGKMLEDRRCRDCETRELKEQYWAGPGPWRRELPRLVRELKRAAKEKA